MAWIRSTVLCGSSRSVSRVPGPPPRTSTEATAPAGAAIIVAPESPSPPSLIACPTPRPRTSISELLGPGWVPNNSADILELARRTVIRVLWILWPLVGGLAPALRRAVPWVIHQLCRQLPHHRLQQAVLVESQPSDQLLGCLNTVRPLRAVQRGLAELVIVIPHVVDSREPGLDFLLAQGDIHRTVRTDVLCNKREVHQLAFDDLGLVELPGQRGVALDLLSSFRKEVRQDSGQCWAAWRLRVAAGHAGQLRQFILRGGAHPLHEGVGDGGGAVTQGLPLQGIEL